MLENLGNLCGGKVLPRKKHLGDRANYSLEHRHHQRLVGMALKDSISGSSPEAVLPSRQFLALGHG